MTNVPPNPRLDTNQNSDGGMPIPVKIVKNDEQIRVTDRRFWAQDQTTESEVPESGYSFKPAYVEELEKKLADSKRNLEEVVASYREYKADTAAENHRIRERIQNDYNRRLLQARIDIVNKFIDILENFDRALVAAKNNPAFESLLGGVQLIRNQFLATLGELGVSELEVNNKRFDPEVAEAVGTVEVLQVEQDQQIMEVVGKGYVLNQTLVRPAKVRVGKFVSNEENSAL
jgi:molecular chaperone GrpE